MVRFHDCSACTINDNGCSFGECMYSSSAHTVAQIMGWGWVAESGRVKESQHFSGDLVLLREFRFHSVCSTRRFKNTSVSWLVISGTT